MRTALQNVMAPFMTSCCYAKSPEFIWRNPRAAHATGYVEKFSKISMKKLARYFLR